MHGVVIKAKYFSIENDIDTGYCRQDNVYGDPPPAIALSHYADYLRAVYANYPVGKSDEWPPTASTVYIKLALVKKERVEQWLISSLASYPKETST